MYSRRSASRRMRRHGNRRRELNGFAPLTVALRRSFMVERPGDDQQGRWEPHLSDPPEARTSETRPIAIQAVAGHPPKRPRGVVPPLPAPERHALHRRFADSPGAGGAPSAASVRLTDDNCTSLHLSLSVLGGAVTPARCAYTTAPLPVNRGCSEAVSHRQTDPADSSICPAPWQSRGRAGDAQVAGHRFREANDSFGFVASATSGLPVSGLATATRPFHRRRD
jgi:hypothetical protein